MEKRTVRKANIASGHIFKFRGEPRSTISLVASVFGTLLSAGVAGVATWLNALTRAERIIRIIVSIIFIGTGIYYVVLWIQA